MKTSTYSLIAIAILTLAACGPKGAGAPPAAAAGAAPPPLEVDVVTVATGSVVITQDLPGRLEAYRSAQVRARVEGVVEKRLFVEGSDVKAGDMLYKIDARNYAAAYESAKSDLAVARQTVERYKPLLEARAVSQQEYDLAEARLKQSETAMARAQLDFDSTHVPAPIAGRIGRAMVTEGALVGRGEATLLATIEQINPIYANFTQSGFDALRLHQAFKSGKLSRTGETKVELLLDDGSVYAQPGKLLFTNLAVDPGTGSVLMRAEFPNAKYELLPGMFARIRFPEGSVNNSIRVPQRAVQMTPQGQFVTVVDGEGKAAMRPIRTGGMTGSDFVIEEGLQAGDKVIVNGLQKARPGTPVKAVEWSPEGNSPTQNALAATEKK
ncbi:MAG: efflux RND transporter periplasmic adaptor subunit [Sideroxyarcus sp.]|nr:efflux RND transporter periplasmic adaptor subunit [Sideroxyarcus sp.]